MDHGVPLCHGLGVYRLPWRYTRPTPNPLILLGFSVVWLVGRTGVEPVTLGLRVPEGFINCPRPCLGFGFVGFVGCRVGCRK